ASQAGKVDLVSRTVEFRVRVCDFGQKVPCPPVVRTNDVSVRNDKQYFFRHDHSLVRSIAMLVRTAGPNIFRDQPEPGSKPGRPSDGWTYAPSRPVRAPAAGLTGTAAFTAPSFNAERKAVELHRAACLGVSRLPLGPESVPTAVGHAASDGDLWGFAPSP